MTGPHNSESDFWILENSSADVPVVWTPSGVSRFLNSSVRTASTTAHPRAMLTTPNEHPQLTSVDVRLPTTRGAIGLIALKDRALSPVAKLFAQSVAPVLQDIQPKRISRAAQK
jgi:hypothetical protein